MTTIYSLVIFLATVFFMEFMAWFTHKYLMHGFLWPLHKYHHVKDHKSWFERNDAFFIFYAIVSIICFYLWSYHNIWFTLAIGLGIMAYGATYFIVHDIFIHQRFKMFRKANNWYAKGIRRAHKIHHKHTGKEDGECFGMLFVPLKFFKK